MPCMDGAWPVDDRGDRSDREAEQLVKIDNLTRMLCALCKLVTPTQIRAVPGLSRWWAAHQRADAKRIAHEAALADRERRRTVAFKKLSAADREVLGL
jgi:hypothetical protein